MSAKARRSARRTVLLAIALSSPFVLPAFGAVEFRHALDDSPLDLAPIEGETITDAVKTFRETGEDPYTGNAEAIAEGKALYEENCQTCHMPDGTGGMGPSLVDDVFLNERANTDVGKFEIIHSGASGAMRPFSKRGVTQDQMLKLIAYIHTLKK